MPPPARYHVRGMAINIVTKDKYLLIEQGSDLKGQVKHIQRAKLFKQNGEVIINGVNTNRLLYIEFNYLK